MSANESFLAAMGIFERWEAKERAGPKQKP
jgi:hypothetical protein